MASGARRASRAHQIGHNRLKKEVPCSHYIASNNLSDIAPNSLILGVCGVDLESSNPDVEGYYVSDFYAFNAMLRGLGAKQSWIASVSPTKLVEAYGDFSHGRPYEPSKVVLSKHIIDNKLITAPSVVPSGEMTETFSRALREYRDESEDTGAPIVVFLFAPVSPHIEEDEYYRIDYSAEIATAIKGLANAAVMIRPDCCSKMPEFKDLHDGTVRCPKTFVRQLARAHAGTCAGDWEMSQQMKFRQILWRFLRNEAPAPEDFEEAYEFIEFRTSSMDLAGEMVDRLGLPRPLGRRCIWWNPLLRDFEGRHGTSINRIHDIYCQLKNGVMESVIPLRRSHGRAILWPFTRPAYYIAAAMELAGWNSDQVAEALAKMKKWKKLYEVAAVEEKQDPEGWVLIEHQEEWVQIDRAKYWWRNIECRDE